MKTRKLLTAVIAFLAFALTTIAQTVPSNVPTNGLVGYWGFNGNANDQSGNGNNGTVNGATLTTDRNGNANSAYSFDGVSNYIHILDAPSLRLQNATINCWVKYTSMNKMTLLVKTNIINADDTNYLIEINDYGQILGPGPRICGIYGGCGSQNYSTNHTPGIDLSGMLWHQLTAVYDVGLMKIYIDGTLVGSEIAPLQSLNACAGSDLLLGRSWQNYPLWYSGELDDVAIYNRALTQSEITQLYTSTSSTQNLCTKTVQPYNVNDGDATHDGSTYDWSISPSAPNAIITGNGTNSITIDWTNVSDGSYRLQAIETSVNGCVSTAVAATINITATPAPIAQPQTFCTTATVADLVATGTNLQWYATATDGTPLDTNNALVTGTYYVSQTIGSCESLRTAVAVTITPQITPLFTQIASTCSGSNLTVLPTTSINGISGTWSPALNNTVTTTYTFTPNNGQCANSFSQTITITTPKVTSPISFVEPTTTVAALPSVTIGTQIWTSKNLDVTTYRDGTPIPQVTDGWENLTTGAWCYYDNDPANGAVYGKLYNWYAVVGIYDAASLTNPALRKPLAPAGWHVSSDVEWSTLINYIDPNANGGYTVPNMAGGKMKEIGIPGWSTTEDAINNSGLRALPGAGRDMAGRYWGIGGNGNWWSTSEVDIDNNSAWSRGLWWWDTRAMRSSGGKTSGAAVRLIKD